MTIKCYTGKKARWYCDTEHGFWVPSVTSIIQMGFPKGIGLIQWFKKNTEEEINRKSQESRDEGKRIHEIIERTIKGEEVGEQEKEDVRGFHQWVKDSGANAYDSEKLIFDPVRLYAGTADALCEMGGQTYVVDFKKSQGIYSDYYLQVAAYAYSLGLDRAIIVQLKDTKKGYAYKTLGPDEVEEAYFKGFQPAYKIASYLGIFEDTIQYE